MGGLQCSLLDTMRLGVDSRGPCMPTAARAVVLESLVDSVEAASEAEAKMGACRPSPFAGRGLVVKPWPIALGLEIGRAHV